MAASLLIILIFFSFSLCSFSLYSPFLCSTSPNILNAAQTLVDSNHLSMSLTLQLISQYLLLHSKSLTIFAPSDLNFIQFGQPTLCLLNAHFVPRRISIAEIKALPQGSTLPTLSPAVKLLITGSPVHGSLSINNVGVKDFAIFDDGSVVIYAIDHFFNASGSRIPPPSSFGAPNSSARSDPNSNGFDPKPSGFVSKPFGLSPINPVMEALSSLGYVKMATFLDMQLGLQRWPMQDMKLTVFAPDDETIDQNVVSFGNYSSIFRAHVVPGLLRWLDLLMMKDGTQLETFSDAGFRINVSKSGDLVVVNGVSVMSPDIYCADMLVIHGLSKALWPVATQEGGTQELKLRVKESSVGSDYDADFEDYYGNQHDELGD